MAEDRRQTFGATLGQHEAPVGAVQTVLSDSQTEPASTVVQLRRGPGKPPGYPKPPGSGRQKGVQNKRSREVADAMRPLLPKARRALVQLLESTDAELQFKATSLVYAYTFGRPTERKEVGGIPGQPVETNATARVEVDTLERRLSVCAALGLPVNVAGRALKVPREMATAATETATTGALELPEFEIARRALFAQEVASRELTETAHAVGIDSLV